MPAAQGCERGSPVTECLPYTGGGHWQGQAAEPLGLPLVRISPVNFSKLMLSAVAAAIIGSTSLAPTASAGPLDGLAGGAIGFALGAMAAAPRQVYHAPRPQRVIVYRDRPSRRHVAAAPVRRRAAPSTSGAAISTVSDPFAGSGSARSIPVNGR